MTDDRVLYDILAMFFSTFHCIWRQI